MAAVAERVVIVGAGIGGLTLAHGLARLGLEVQVIEIGDRGERLGTGITLLGNALRALDVLGLADEVMEGGYGWDVVSNRDAAGNVVHDQEVTRIFRADGPAAVGIMRTRLAEILEARAIGSGALIQFGTTIQAIVDDGHEVAVTFSDGKVARADLVVAADGVYSRTREMIFGDQYQPRFAGQSVWRYTIPRPGGLTGLTLYRQGSRVIGGLPIAPDLAYLFYLENSPSQIRMPDHELGELLRARFEGFTAPEIRRAADEIGPSRHVSFRPFDVMLMPSPWYRGRVVLLGDAAHSLTPQLTSGAGMAIEDAVVLTQELSDRPDLSGALKAYDARRSARVAPIFATSLQICELEQSPGDSTEDTVRLLVQGFQMLGQPL